MQNIMKHFLVWLLFFCLSFLTGNFPGWIQIHESNKASYVSNSHCLISTNTTKEEFSTLAEWCGSLHHP